MTSDPLQMMGQEMKYLTKNIKKLLGSGHPMLDKVAKYYTQAEGKHIRPMVVLLMSRATSTSPKRPRHTRPPAPAAGVDRSISPLHILSDYNPLSATSSSVEEQLVADDGSDILSSQRRLAEITELIHTASLLHDDIIDEAGMRRSRPSANVAFGNKMAVLAGDFLLGRASVALARLRDAEVVELLATVIANLVEGEFMQLKNTALDEGGGTHAGADWAEDALSFYLRKTYLKTASLISKSCRASALLGHCVPEVVEAAYAYGKNLGMAFQLVDDMLDYTVSADELGKPAGADLELGLVTAPLLFAWKEHEELGALVQRRFQGEGDVDRVSDQPLKPPSAISLYAFLLFFSHATLILTPSIPNIKQPPILTISNKTKARNLVLQSSGVEQTRALAQEYADKAMHAIQAFPDGDAKDGLVDLCVKVMNRRK